MIAIPKKTFKRVMLGLFALLVLVGASLIPTFWLKTGKMSELCGSWVTVYYESEAEAAQDVFKLAEEKSKLMAEKLGFDTKQNINIYIYDNQSTFQTKKYGIITALLGLDWYIGDNKGRNVLLTSPARPGPIHDYKNNKQASLHEMVHAYNSILNPTMPLWLNEGAALYLTNGNPPENLYSSYKTGIPTLKQTQKTNPISFNNMGGYDFACTYIEYLNLTYGWDKVLALLRTADYEKIFGKNEETIYYEWIEFLKANYNKI